jgi:methylmalonyl-CoA mutase
MNAGSRTGCAADLELVPALAARASAFPRLVPVTVDATVYADAGGGDADEIAMATSVGVAYLRALTDAGGDIDTALAELEFRFTVAADQFLSIAKLRAARRVWDRVAELCGAGPQRRGQRQHAVTSAAMMTRRDPWVNMLRTTVACFAAAVGGADAITVLPFDSAIGIPDDFGRRIARNTSSILHDESSLARVVDPVGGSWYVEQLTDDVAQRAWDAFTAIERAGGALAALDSGVLGERIDRVRTRRLDDIAHRRAPLTGVSEYALVSEAPVLRPPAPAPPAGPLPLQRYAEPYEFLRDRADAAAAERGMRPSVLLLALGPRSSSAARVAFAGSLFQAGGIEPVVVDEIPDDLCSPNVACLCGTDDDYRRSAAAAALSLKRAGADWVWLAGGQQFEDVDGTIDAGDDVLAALTRTLELLGVA